MEKYQEVLSILDYENPFIDREWGLVNSLKFDEQLEYEESIFYQNELHINAEEEIQEARSELENKFRLSNNADILLSHADELYTQCRFKECLEVTTNKASTMDSHCGPAWVGFGHTFAIESDHDQAYSTATKLYSGPTLFIGMQYLQAKNLLFAEEYLLTSSVKNALKVAEETKCLPQVWETIWINLSHAFRQLW
ncbi:hypothetical protein C2G38_2176957 [Gigaspora rosea]|uniref:Uncharacterized protein n=1 Tax=Gigaspora rosea TaxID=44941 RepID=A0A397VHP6_9GLOM|nr:hypothetical protein C2G38_2176957 [Gigaspora rosea]